MQTSAGCELPEELRQYYLDVMGITRWQERDSFDQHADIDYEHTLSSEPDVAQQSWQQLEQSVAACSTCESLCDSRTQPVFGIGNRAADILVIGESPDTAEDRLGKPFVEQEGRLLTAMLKAIDVDVASVFITNSLKCRLPKKRDPSVSEVENCNLHLHQQIRLLQPKAILVLGHVPAQNLSNSKSPIGEIRGEVFDFEGIPVIASYHPRYLLHKPSEKRKAWQDLLRLKSLISTWQ